MTKKRERNRTKGEKGPAQPKPYLTPEEYLNLERSAEFKSEYFDGETFAMSGGSRSHNLIISNVVGELRAQLRERPCVTYPSDMRLQIPNSGLFTYPDVTVVCGEERFSDNRGDTLLTPTLLFEVLSPSTEAYDRGMKFDHYRRIASLREYVLIAQNDWHVELYTRQSDERWLLTVFHGPDIVVELASIRCSLALSEVYHKVRLASKPPLREVRGNVV